MNKKEVLGYIITVKSAGLLAPLCILEGITHFECLSTFFWVLIVLCLAGVFSGLLLAGSAEKSCC